MGGLINTDGTLVVAYPAPALVMAIPVTVPADPIITEPSALLLSIDPVVEPKLTVAVVYPTPPSVISTDDIVPAAETIAVPAAPVLIV